MLFKKDDDKSREMNEYLVRVCPDYDFCAERLSTIGGFWQDLLEKVSAETEATLPHYRFTYALIRLKAENAKECRRILLDAWKKAYGEACELPELILLKRSSNEELDDTVHSAFNFYGATEYQRLVAEMNETVPVLEERGGKQFLMNQNYLFSIDRGCGFSSLLSSFSYYLKTCWIFPEERNINESFSVKKEAEGGSKASKDTEKKAGESDSDSKKAHRTRYVEYVIGKETGEGGCTSADDFIEAISDEENTMQYGAIGVDISYFLEGSRKDELRELLRRMEPYQYRNVFVFRIPFLEKKAFDEVAGILEDAMILKTVKIPPLNECVVLEMVWNIINETNYSPDADIIDVVFDKIHEEKRDGRFYGFKTAEKIAVEILMKKAAVEAKLTAGGETPDTERIVASDIADLVSSKRGESKGYEALSELIGMEKITERVKEIVAQVKVSAVNEKLDRPCIHMRFTGAPGTGKTTVARILGEILREEGILRKGGFFEYSGRDLVAEYVGQTAVKTSTICHDAYGSVLFIDEAYGLYSEDGPGNNDYGKEAVTTLVAEMENHRDDMLVIMAGYTDDMDRLMKMNEGLRSRMPILLHFENYTKEQLFEIYMLMVKKHFEYTEDLEAAAKEYFLSLSDEYMSAKEFSNARFVRNLYERTWSKAALRASLEGKSDFVLKKEDFTAASLDREFSEKITGKKKIGF